MRTTLTLDDDALALARELARRRGLSLGKALSELVRRGASVTFPVVLREGLAVVQLPADSPVVTSEDVQRLADEMP